MGHFRHHRRETQCSWAVTSPPPEPPPLPPHRPNLLSLWICLFCTFHVSGTRPRSSVWLVTWNMFSRLVQAATCIMASSLLWLNNNIPSCGQTTFCLSCPFLHSWALDCFYLFGIVNSAEHRFTCFCWTAVFSSFERWPRSRIAGSYGNSVERISPFSEVLSNCFPWWFPHFIFLPARCEVPVSPCPLQQNKTKNKVIFLNYSYPSGCAVVSHCDFDLQFPHD